MNKPSAQSMTIVQLYPHDMNIYGDNGNVLVLKKRLEWRGIHADIVPYNVGDTLPDTVDIIIGGGGQDSGQDAVHTDLLSIAPRLRNWAKQAHPCSSCVGSTNYSATHLQQTKARVLLLHASPRLTCLTRRQAVPMSALSVTSSLITSRLEQSLATRTIAVKPILAPTPYLSRQSSAVPVTTPTTDAEAPAIKMLSVPTCTVRSS